MKSEDLAHFIFSLAFMILKILGYAWWIHFDPMSSIMKVVYFLLAFLKNRCYLLYWWNFMGF